MAAHGWPLVDDDGIRVQARAHGFHAVPGYSGIRLLPDAASAVLPGVVAGRPMARGHRKRRFAVDGTLLTMASGATPIGAVYLLDRADGDETSANRLPFGEALVAVVEHAFHVAADHTKLNRQAFELSSALAAKVPVWKLLTPQGLERMPSTLATLDHLDESLVQAN